MVSAHAQPAADYKALVCVFLFGGNDSNNMIVPIDSRYGAYQTMRGPVALARRRAAAGRRQRLRAASGARQRAAALRPAARGAGLQRRHAGAADDEGDAQQHDAAAEPLLALGPDAAVADAPIRTAAAPAGAAASTIIASALNTGALPSGHHRQRRQRAVPVGSDHKGLNFSNAGFVRAATVRRRHGDDRAPRLAAAAAHVRQRPEAGERRQRRARRFDPVGAGDRTRRSTARRRCRSRSRTAASASSSRRSRRSSPCAARSA